MAPTVLANSANHGLWQLRDITQVFISRPELVSPGETTEEHRAQQHEEANLVDREKAIGATTGKGLFGVRFRDTGPRRIPIIRDEEDGVDRCPRCTWELEDGWCEGCGYGAFDGHSETGMSDSDRSFYVGNELGNEFPGHHLEDDDMGLYGAAGYLEGRHGSLDHATSAGSDGNAQSEDHDTRAYQAVARARQRVRHHMAAVHHARYWHGRDIHGLPSNIYDDEDDEGYTDTEQYSSDGSAGSLDDFIADEDVGRSPLEESRRGSNYDSDDGTEAAMGNESEYAHGGFSPPDLGLDSRSGRTNSTAGIQHSSEDDSDEAPIARRRLIEAQLDESDDDAEMHAMHVQRLQNPRNIRRIIDSSGGMGNWSPSYRHHPLENTGAGHGGRSQQAPIEIGSDSDIPMPVPRPRRNRQIVDRETSDDNATTTNSHHSTSSDTIRRGSPTNSLTRIPVVQNARQRRRPASHVVRSSSPVRDHAAEECNRTTSSPPLNRPSRSRIIRDHSPTWSDASSNSFVDDAGPRRAESRRRLPNMRRPPLRNRRNRLVVPHAPHNTLSPTPSAISVAGSPRSPRRAPRSEASRRFHESDEARAAAKAERKRMKQERRRRNRETPYVAPQDSDYVTLADS